jgi:hypothetical protein
MNSKKIILLLLAASGIAGADPAHALTRKFCLTNNMILSDNDLAANGNALLDGTTEAYWKTDGAQPMRGHWVRVSFRIPPSTTYTDLWTGYLDDGLGNNGGSWGAGCTPSITWADNNYIRIVVGSTAHVQGNSIGAQKNDDTYYVTTELGTITGAPPSPYPVPHSLGGDTADAFRLSMIGAYALYRHAGGESGNVYVILTGTIGGVPITESEYSGGYVKIEPGDDAAKFVVAHELGHNLVDEVVGSFATSPNYSLDIGVRCDAPNRHRMKSIEYQSAALAEGVADFYAADVFNDHYDTVGALRYWGADAPSCTSTTPPQLLNRVPTVDIEAGGPGDSSNPRHNTAVSPSGCSSSFLVDLYPQCYMETVCDGLESLSINDRGTEVDWMRTFWDMHTASSPVSFNAIMDLLRVAGAVWLGVEHDKIDDAADAIGGNTNTQWDGSSHYNGIDH